MYAKTLIKVLQQIVDHNPGADIAIEHDGERCTPDKISYGQSFDSDGDSIGGDDEITIYVS